MRQGIHPRTLYALRDAGLLESLSWGILKLVEHPAPELPDLVLVALAAPSATLCLISALSFHELTTQIPHAVTLALPPGRQPPKIEGLPLHIVHMSGPALTQGIEIVKMDGVRLRVFNREKSLADAFKFRNQIGLDVALEALITYRRRGSPRVDLLERYARICRVWNVMKPYLEALQ